jgi:coenzyme F420-reducing hydrogenase delta subunit/NAD-dependent dihydropyrimidine dehydrogenase PreA subunit
MDTATEFKPRIIGFLCNWCCYGGADLCGVSRFQYPPYLRVIRLMCSGRVDLAFVLRAFAKGADGVFIGGCHINDCHYNTEGNYDALSMTVLCKKLMIHIGLNPERLRLEWVSAGEGIRFADIMNDFARKVKQLGPLGSGEEKNGDELTNRIEAVAKFIPYIKLAKREKLALHCADEARYQELYTSSEIDRLLSEAPTYAIDPDKCQACMICLRKCPVKAIAGGKKQIHVIYQNICIKCGTCLEVCPPRFGAVVKGRPDQVPLGIREEARKIIRGKRIPTVRAL